MKIVKLEAICPKQANDIKGGIEALKDVVQLLDELGFEVKLKEVVV